MDGKPLSVVLVHGLGVTERIFFEPEKERLLFIPLSPFFKGGEALGQTLKKQLHVLSWTQDTYGSVEGESEKLLEIEKRVKEYVIIAHSRGGLIARYAIQRHGIRPRALICLATPHRGSALADLAHRVKKVLRWASPRFFEAVGEMKTSSILLDWLNGHLEREATIPHFDVAGSRPFYFLRYVRPLLPSLEEIKEGAGDGLVSLSSARSPLTREDHFFCLPVNHASILVDKRVHGILQTILTCIMKGLA